MARARKKKTLNPWTAADVKVLRGLAGRKYASEIARRLKRTEGATRQKAHALGISLQVR